jgi:hypothetical protein
LANGRTWPGQKAGDVGHSPNNIKRILDGCVVRENFSRQASIPLRGTSVCIFDTNAGKWKQTWGDNEGLISILWESSKKGQMILEREAIGKDGKKSLPRMVGKNIAVSEFDWSWESSHDSGKNWQGSGPSTTNANSESPVRRDYFCNSSRSPLLKKHLSCFRVNIY